MPIPTSDHILAVYDALPNNDKTPKGFAPRTPGRVVFCEWFIDEVSEGSYETRAGVLKVGHTPVRLRGLYLLEKALNKRNRQRLKEAKNS